jgi:hypothetical protein
MLCMVELSTSQFSGERSVGAQDLSIGGLLYESATREPDAVALIAGVLRQLELL